MIVADVNLVAYAMIPGPRTEQVERVRSRDKNWIAPSILPHELLSVLGKHMRKAGMARDRAIAIYRRGLSVVRIHKAEPDPVVILRLVEQSGCTTYDAEYVWLSRELGVQGVTADQELANSFPDDLVLLDDF